MTNILRNNKGFTFTEVMFVGVIAMIVIATILSSWIFTHKTWAVEGEKTQLRINLLKATETIQEDLRLSSGIHMSFYPAGAVGGVYTAISMPLAVTDEDGFFAVDESNNIIWDKTVIYHIFKEQDGTKTLRRTVFDNRDNTLTKEERYAQLANLVAGVAGRTGNALTEDKFLVNLEVFDISTQSSMIDFYMDTLEAERVGKLVFGWALMSAGDHTIRFEVTGKNDDSSGYAFGIDSLMIEPCGSPREAEYYSSSFAPSGALVSDGNNVNIVNGTMWGNDNYLEYDASRVGAYIEITDYYDLWRESSFENAGLNNTMVYGDEVRVKLELPADRESGKEEIAWTAYAQTTDAVSGGSDEYLPGYPITVRTIISNDKIDMEGDLVRVKFKSATRNPLKIERAYITRRDVNENGLVNDASGVSPPSDYHMHQELFFRDEYDMDSDGSTSDIVRYLYIPPGSEVWSEWVAFPFVQNDAAGIGNDYFITFCIPDMEDVVFPSGWSSFDAGAPDCKAWYGASTNTYYITTGSYTSDLLPAAGTPDWSGYVVDTADEVYVATEIDTWKSTGTVESGIFDTQQSSPSYNKIKWSENSPTGTQTLLKARSSNDEDMAGASDWSAIAGSASNPHGISIGDWRYVQFLAEISTDLFWEAPGYNVNYPDYVDEQRSGVNVYDFPMRGGEYLVTGIYSAWVDDVEIDWPGEDKVCLISGYVAKRNDYGQAKITIDGQDLVKTLSIQVGVLKEVQDREIREESVIEVEPRNTGK